MLTRVPPFAHPAQAQMAGSPPPCGDPAPMEDTCGDMGPTQAVMDFMNAQLALGSSWGEAAGLAASVHGIDAVAPITKATCPGKGRPLDAVHMLDDAAQGSPALANRWLTELLTTKQLKAWKEGHWGLHLEGREWITNLPPDLKVNGLLNLKDCRAFRALPSGLRVDGYLVMAGCTALQALPDDLWAGVGIDVYGCTALDRLPDALRLEGFLNLGHCTALKALPEGIKVKTWLDLTGCTSLERLPDGLKTGASLILRGCTAIVELPAALDVKWTLDLRGCTAWDGCIPDDAQVGGNVFTDRRSAGISLAEWRELHPNGELFNKKRA